MLLLHFRLKPLGLFPCRFCRLAKFLKKISFKEAVPFMDNLKIRASIGRLGSDRAIESTMTYFSTATLSADPRSRIWYQCFERYRYEWAYLSGF